MNTKHFDTNDTRLLFIQQVRIFHDNKNHVEHETQTYFLDYFIPWIEEMNTKYREILGKYIEHWCSMDLKYVY